MCEVCEGKKPIPELSVGYDCPGPIWFGVNGLNEYARLSHNSRCGCDLTDDEIDRLDEFETESLNADIQKMAELKANAYSPDAEISAFYRFKFCPECGRSLVEEYPKTAKEGTC